MLCERAIDHRALLLSTHDADPSGVDVRQAVLVVDALVERRSSPVRSARGAASRPAAPRTSRG